MADIGEYKCSQPECSVETTGKCVNGLSVEDCPNKIGIINKIEEDDLPVLNSPDPKTIRLPWGDSFLESELQNITFKYPCKLILLVGEPSCGKSTLFAALFDSFHQGSCGNYIFSSTRTPIGFEKICHLAREKSKGKKPDTERTKSHEFTYFHLAVRIDDLSKPTQHLIFADVNGEKFQSAKVDDNEIIKLNILRRADHIFFIGDGNLLTINEERQIVKRDVWNMLTRCIQNNMFNENQGVHLIVTKWDEITSAGKSKEINEFFIEPTVSKFSMIKEVIKVASRSLNDEVPPRTGIDKFLSVCLRGNNKPKEKLIPRSEREFQKFKYEKR